jgi:hypothetical protein
VINNQKWTSKKEKVEREWGKKESEKKKGESR